MNAPPMASNRKQTQTNQTMKTKLTLLAATLLVGFSAASVSASPDKDFSGVRTAPKDNIHYPLAGQAGLKSCCDLRAPQVPGPNKGGWQADRSVACRPACTMPQTANTCNGLARNRCAR